MRVTLIDEHISHVEDVMRDVIADAEAQSADRFESSDLPLYDVIRYHLGWVTSQFRPDRADQGKRVRPIICLLSAGAAGGEVSAAVPVAAAIELLHNFTLLHDDIQDRSEFRRGRSTVWVNWGEAQAINAGDATFALSQLALLRAGERGVDSDLLAELMLEFNHTTLRIVEGQVLDLGFEQRWDITPDDYLRMISGKTAAIVAFAAWGGSRIGGASAPIANKYYEFGRLLGLGFQVRDDFLGIWGEVGETGKSQGDDIRGRKKSIPIVMLLERLGPRQHTELERIYSSEEIQSKDVDHVMQLLEDHSIADRVQHSAKVLHDQALELFEPVAEKSAYRDALLDVIERLVDRNR